jgi:hypothetical protein
MSELEESMLRSQAMLLIFRQGNSGYVWKRVMKRFLKCIKMNKITLGELK